MADFEGGGWAIDLEDRDALVAGSSDEGLITALASQYDKAELPREVDYRPLLRMENQGPQGSCQGQSITTSVEKIYMDQGTTIQLSRQFAYTESQRKDGLIGRDRGSTIRSGVTVAMEGLPLEEYWPYPRPVKYEVNSRLRSVCLQKRDYTIQKYYMLTSPDAVLEFVTANQGAVHMGIVWSKDMSGAGAMVTRYSGRSGGGHAICLLGYKKIGNEYYPRLFNSHGSRYGDNGTTLISPSVIGSMLKVRHTVMIGVTRLDKPKPQNWDYLTNPVTY